MPNDFIFWSYFLKYYMLRNISAFFLMNKLATKILVCLQYFKVLDNSIGRLKDKKDKRRIFGAKTLRRRESIAEFTTHSNISCRKGLIRLAIFVLS